MSQETQLLQGLNFILIFILGPDRTAPEAARAMNSYHVCGLLGPLTPKTGTIHVNLKKCQMLVEVLGIVE